MGRSTAAVAAALAAALSAGAAARAAPSPAPAPPAARLPFVSDDYPRALAEARAGHRPLVVEVWAPW